MHYNCVKLWSLTWGVFMMWRSATCVGRVLMYVVGCDRKTDRQWISFSTFFGFSLIVTLITVTHRCQQITPTEFTPNLQVDRHISNLKVHLVFISLYPLSHLFVAVLAQRSTELAHDRMIEGTSEGISSLEQFIKGRLDRQRNLTSETQARLVSIKETLSDFNQR